MARFLRRSGAPDAVGGRRRCRGPTPGPARCLPIGHLVAGLLHQHARVGARSKANFYVLSREHHLTGRAAVASSAQPRQSRRAGRSSPSPRPAGSPPCRESASPLAADPPACCGGRARRARSASRDRCPATPYQLTTPAAFRPRAPARPRTAALRPARPRSGARSPSPRASPAASGWTARRSAAAAWASHPR